VIYINRYGQGQRETVSECETRKQAREELAEYQLSKADAELLADYLRHGEHAATVREIPSADLWDVLDYIEMNVRKAIKGAQ